MVAERKINPRFATDKLCVSYTHVGLFDTQLRRLWIAKKKYGVDPMRVSHARLLTGGGKDSSTAAKDRFICYWFHTPDTGKGHVLGYPIDWSEGHLQIRLDPNWNYRTRRFLPTSDSAKVERNIEQQYEWGQWIFEVYTSLKPTFPVSWHMIGPRATDSMFYIQRVETPL